MDLESKSILKELHFRVRISFLLRVATCVRLQEDDLGQALMFDACSESWPSSVASASLLPHVS